MVLAEWDVERRCSLLSWLYVTVNMDKNEVPSISPSVWGGSFGGGGEALVASLESCLVPSSFRAPAVCWLLGRTDEVLALMESRSSEESRT